MRPDLLLLLAATASAKFSVFDDLFSFPKYALQFKQIDRENIASLLKENYTLEYLTDGDTKYVCEVPGHYDTEKPSATDEELKLFEEVVRSSIHGKKSLYYPDPHEFFTYELNLESLSILQLHLSSNPANVLNYTLGTARELSFRIDDTNAFVTELKNGTLCDLNNKPRTSEIKFYCSEQSEALKLISVMEYRTCQYLALVNVPELCQFEFFQNPNKVEKVTCYEIQNQTRQNNEEAVGLKVNLADFEMDKFGSGLFVGQSDTELAIFDTSAEDMHVTQRIVNSAFNLLHILRVIPTGRTYREFISGLILMNQKLSVNANIYDRFGQYLHTIQLSLVNNIESDEKKSNNVLILINYIPYGKFVGTKAVFLSDYDEEEEEETQQTESQQEALKETKDQRKETVYQTIVEKVTETLVQTVTIADVSESDKRESRGVHDEL